MLERVGIFGGTFDPIHCGHLVVAADAHDHLSLDLVLFVVARNPWQKTVGTPTGIRYNMVERAVRYLPWAEASNIEMVRRGPTLTIETLEELSSPDRELFLLLGQDQWENRHTWHRWDEINDLARPHVTPRWLGISSTDIRERIRTGRPIKHLVPDCVQLYLEEHQVYPKE